MNKKLLKAFVVFIVSSLVGVGAASCSDVVVSGNSSSNTTDNPNTVHEHEYVQKVNENYLASEATCTEPAKYYYSCECGEMTKETFDFGEPLGHIFDVKEATEAHLATAADHHNKATYYVSCSRCGANDINNTFEYGEPIAHTFDKKVTTDEYLVSEATCTEPAKYYYSCECGDKGTEVFEEGDPLGHVFGDWEYHYRETPDGQDTKVKECSRCHEIEEIEVLEGSQSVNNLCFEITSEAERTCKVTGYKQFYNDERDNNIVIPETWNGYRVTSIRDHAFNLCSSLTSVTMGDSVTSIGYSAFYNCTSLTSIEIPDSVTSIGDHAFNLCSSLTSVTMGDSVTSIGYSAFEGCTSLTSIVIPDSVTSIGGYAFFECSSLALLTIGNSVETIGKHAFYNCTSLTSIEIPDSVTSISDSSFFNCSSLTSIVIPDSVIEIGRYAFDNCSSLADVFYTGDSYKWNGIIVAEGNFILEQTLVHYNYYVDRTSYELTRENKTISEMIEIISKQEHAKINNSVIYTVSGYVGNVYDSIYGNFNLFDESHDNYITIYGSSTTETCLVVEKDSKGVEIAANFVNPKDFKGLDRNGETAVKNGDYVTMQIITERFSDRNEGMGYISNIVKAN